MPPRQVPPCPNCSSERTTEALSVPDWAYCPNCGHLWPLGTEPGSDDLARTRVERRDVPGTPRIHDGLRRLRPYNRRQWLLSSGRWRPAAKPVQILSPGSSKPLHEGVYIGTVSAERQHDNRGQSPSQSDVRLRAGSAGCRRPTVRIRSASPNLKRVSSSSTGSRSRAPSPIICCG